MTAITKIDKAGRMVLPKAIREKMHLREGSRLRVEFVRDKIELTLEAEDVKIEEREDGLPVIAGWEGFDAAKAVREAREEYLDHLSGNG